MYCRNGVSDADMMVMKLTDGRCKFHEGLIVREICVKLGIGDFGALDEAMSTLKGTPDMNALVTYIRTNSRTCQLCVWFSENKQYLVSGRLKQ